MTDDEIRKLAEKQGWFAVDSWWSMAIPRFRAMLEEHAAQQSVQADGATCPACEAKSVIVGTQCLVCGVFSPRQKVGNNVRNK